MKNLIVNIKDGIALSIKFSPNLKNFYSLIYKNKEEWIKICEREIDWKNINDKKKFFIELIINSLFFKYTFNRENFLKEPIYNKFILKENLKEELIYLENLILEKSSDYLKNSKIDFIATIFFNSSSKIKNALEEFVDLNIIHFIQNLYTHSSVEKFNSICLENEKALN